MAQITVDNKDWAVIDDLKAALADATIDGQDAFRAVSAATSVDQARQCRFTDHPLAIVCYVGTREWPGPEGIIGCELRLEVLLASKAAATPGDHSARLQEALRLVNAAKNAAASSAPSDACGWGTPERSFRSAAFGVPVIDSREGEPWVVARLPVTFGFVLEGAASH